jgi:hypothetical protein
MQPSVGAAQAVQAQVGAVQVRPTLMVRATTPTLPARAFAQNTTQTPSDPTVQSLEHVPMTMAKETKPPLQRRIQRPNDPRQAVPLPSRCAIWNFRTSGLPSSTSLPMRGVLADLASWTSPLIRRLATATGRIEFAPAARNQPFTADWTFASGCFSPRLTTTQLPSATRDQTSLDEDFHLANATTLQAHRCNAVGVLRA